MRKAFQKLNGILFNVSMVFFLVTVIGGSIDVFSRLITASIPWAQRVAVWGNVAVVCLYAPVMLFDESHIRVDFIYAKLKGAAKTVISLINDIAMIAFAAVFLWSGLDWMVYLVQTGMKLTVGLWQLPYWPFVLLLPLSAVLMLVYSLYLFAVKYFVRKTAPTKLAAAKE